MTGTNSSDRGELAALVEKARSGDHEAFRALVEQHQHAVHAAAFSCLGDSSDIQDVVQETFIAAFRALPRLREPRKFGSWLYAIAMRLARRAFRESRSREVPLARALPRVSVQPQEGASRREVAAQLAAAFAALPERQRTALTLFYSEKLTYSEIAAFLDVSLASVKGLIYRAMAQLRETLRRKPED